MNKRKLTFRACGYIFVVLCLFLLFKRSGLTVSDITPETIRALAHDNIILILLIMLVIMVLQNLFTFIPLVLVIATNITLFGFLYGYLYSCFCSILGSTLMFLSVRYLFKDIFSNSFTTKYSEKIEKKGFIFVLSGRILPLLPTNLLNIASGISAIKVSHFLAATTIGNMIYGFVLATASFSIITVALHHPVYLILFALIIITGISVYFYRKKILTEA